MTPGRPQLPDVEEGATPPARLAVKAAAGYKLVVTQAQEDIGTLQWLALTPKPDVVAVVGSCASLPARDPWTPLK